MCSSVNRKEKNEMSSITNQNTKKTTDLNSENTSFLINMHLQHVPNQANK